MATFGATLPTVPKPVGRTRSTLVFTNQGTPPQPPLPPIALHQYQPDGVSAIAADGLVNGNSVVLEATPQGAASDQFNLQFEVRAAGTAFSNPTITSDPVRGGSIRQVAVGALSNQSYHWRVRTLDQYGQPSSWVQFSSGQDDFTVTAPYLPPATFTWSPSLVFVGDLVQFTADEAGTAGLSFAWNFGEGQTASGPTANWTFTSVSDVSVTLTVTDSQGHRTQQSATISVLRKELIDAVNKLAQQTETLLQQVRIQAGDAANAADTFGQELSSLESDSWINFAFSVLGAGLAPVDLKDLLHSLQPELVVDLEADVVQDLAQYVTSGTQAGDTYSAVLLPSVADLVTQKKAELEQLRQQALTVAASIGSAQAEALARDLQARCAGNLALSDDYAGKVLLPTTLADMQSSIEGAWFWTEIGASVAVTFLTAGSSSFVTFLLAESSNLAQYTLDQLNTLSSQPLNVQMFVFSLDAVGQARFVASQMAANAETGLTAVISSRTPAAPPVGSMTVQHFARGSEQGFGFLQYWVTTSAYANITVLNNGSVSTTYRVEASYPKSFTTSQLGLPFNVPGFSVSVNELVALDDIQIDVGQRRVVRIDYLTEKGGEIPQGQINYTLTARTADGYYLAAQQTDEFSTTLIDTNGNQIAHSQLADVVLVGAPVETSLTQFGNAGVCLLNINIRDTFETAVLLNLQQELPRGTTIINAGSATVLTNLLLWEVDLQPGQCRALQTVMQLPIPMNDPPLPSTLVSAYDALNTNWLQLRSLVSPIQVTNVPIPQLEALGFDADGFRLGLQAFVPGVYSLEATGDFTTWTPVATITNAQGSFLLQRP